MTLLNNSRAEVSYVHDYSSLVRNSYRYSYLNIFTMSLFCPLFHVYIVIKSSQGFMIDKQTGKGLCVGSFYTV